MEALFVVLMLSGLATLFDRLTGWMGLLLMAASSVPMAAALALGSTTFNSTADGESFPWYGALASGLFFLLSALVWGRWAASQV